MGFDSFPEQKKNAEKLSGFENSKTKDGDTVDLKWNIVKPNSIDGKNDTKPEQVIIFLPGVAVESDSKPVLESAQHFANAANSATYSISTRLDNPNIGDSQEIQAVAIKEFIEKHGLKNVTIVGNSQGANKAISLVAQLEQTGLNVNGLVLTGPAGIYDQDAKELTKNFFKDAMLETPHTLLSQDIKWKSIKNIGKSVVLGNTVSAGIIKEAAGHPTEFIKRANRESNEAATINEDAKKIKAKIVIVLGARDIAFKSTEIIPDASHGKRISQQKMRGEALKEVFPNSENIKVLEATKLSNHGLHYMRDEEIAETTMYMLRRMERGKAN